MLFEGCFLRGVFHSCFFAELGLFPVSILFTDFVVYRNSFALRQFSADFTILYTHFSEGWIACEGVYWDLLFVGHVQPLARTHTHVFRYSRCILICIDSRHTAAVAIQILQHLPSLIRYSMTIISLCISLQQVYTVDGVWGVWRVWRGWLTCWRSLIDWIDWVKNQVLLLWQIIQVMN